jgi:hypothetical protein
MSLLGIKDSVFLNQLCECCNQQQGEGQPTHPKIIAIQATSVQAFMSQLSLHNPEEYQRMHAENTLETFYHNQHSK